MFLDDVTLTTEGDRDRIELRGIVCTVQPNPRKAEAESALAWARKNEALHPSEAATEARHRAQDRARGHDSWVYTLPTGESYSHPTRAGARHMCRRYFVDSGIVLVPHDHSHMDATDRGTAYYLTQARGRMDGPRVGDFVELPGGRVRRICGLSGNYGPDDGPERFGLTDGGSYALPALRDDSAREAPASYSGGLDWQDEWTVDRLTDTGRTGKGRFWFFHHGRPAAGGGVDVALDCRVYALKGGDA